MFAEFCEEDLFRLLVNDIASGIDECDERMLLLSHSFEMGQSFLGKLSIGIHGRKPQFKANSTP